MTTTNRTHHGGTMNGSTIGKGPLDADREVVTDPAQLPLNPADEQGADRPRARRRRGRGEEPTPALAAALQQRRDGSWFPAAMR